jgi:hypothetical protein
MPGWLWHGVLGIVFFFLGKDGRVLDKIAFFSFRRTCQRDGREAILGDGSFRGKMTTMGVWERLYDDDDDYSGEEKTLQKLAYTFSDEIIV